MVASQTAKPAEAGHRAAARTITSMDQRAKAEALRNLHVPGDPLLLVNAWDAASAVVIARAGARNRDLERRGRQRPRVRRWAAPDG